MMSFEKLENNFVFGASLVHGVMFLKASLHGLKRKRGAPICKHNVFMTGSERLHMGSVCWQDDARSDLAQPKTCEYSIL